MLSCLIVYISPTLVEAQPKSFTTGSNLTPSENIPTFFLVSVNHDSLSRVDDELGYDNRFGIGKSMNISLYESGIWDTLTEGRILRVRVVSPGAISHSFLFSFFHLSENAELYVIEENSSYYKGPYTYKNNKSYNRHTIGSTFGSSHILELYEPFEEYGENQLFLATIYQGYRHIPLSENTYKGKEEQILKRFGTSNTVEGNPDCNPNINCPYGDDWCKEKYAVCLLEMPDGEDLDYCTGSLVNNTANDFRPFILSAWHCANRGTDCDLSTTELQNIQDWVFVFNWWSNTSTNCANNGSEVQALNNINGKEYSGGDFRAGFRDTDMLLLEIKTTNNGGEFEPIPIKGFYYAGWTRSTLLLQQATVLHHPNGDIMKIAARNDSITIEPQGAGHDCADGIKDNNRPITNNYWKVRFEIGHTEGGSSGSALFDENHLIRGVLSSHDVNYRCDEANANNNFGKFHLSWDGGGNSTTRLKDWLDPISINPNSHEGIYSPVELYNRYTEEDEKQLEISIIPDGVAYYHAPTEIRLGGGKSWTTPPLGARNNHSFQFHREYGGDVSAAKRIVLKECLWVPERDGANQKVRFHIGMPQCTIGESAFTPGNPPVKIIMESDAGYSMGTSCDRTTAMSPNEPSERKIIDATHSATSIVPKMSLAPNPAFDYIDIRIEGEKSGDLMLINSLGTRLHVMPSKLSQSALILTARYELANLPAGMYIVMAQSGGQVLTQTFIIIR